MERSLVIIKPDGIRKGLESEIKERLTATGLKIVAEKRLEADMNLASEHYDDLGQRKGEDVKRRMVTFMTSGAIEAMVIEGDNAIEEVRRIVGATLPCQAGGGTIRGDLGDHGETYDRCDAEDRAVENLIHASDAPDTAQREIKLWFPELS
ncbi:MAG: nucleoside-diphosphate kinase [Patescibacteria group bacterium]|nr:nucleoside-diphosphate kinase [Patescibacteria group bacterium]